MTKIQQIQEILGVATDGIWGPKSQAALTALISGQVHTLASSFADPADVRAFQKCKARGGTDSECFKVGDNGMGAGGRFTATEDSCICALPPEIWRPRFGSFKEADGAAVEVTYKTTSVIGILGDTMPSLSNITNGAGIDLNPGFAKALGLNPPFLVPVSYRFV